MGSTSKHEFLKNSESTTQHIRTIRRTYNICRRYVIPTKFFTSLINRALFLSNHANELPRRAHRHHCIIKTIFFGNHQPKIDRSAWFTFSDSLYPSTQERSYIHFSIFRQLPGEWIVKNDGQLRKEMRTCLRVHAKVSFYISPQGLWYGAFFILVVSQLTFFAPWFQDSDNMLSVYRRCSEYSSFDYLPVFAVWTRCIVRDRSDFQQHNWRMDRYL